MKNDNFNQFFEQAKKEFEYQRCVVFNEMPPQCYTEFFLYLNAKAVFIQQEALSSQEKR